MRIHAPFIYLAPVAVRISVCAPCMYYTFCCFVLARIYAICTFYIPSYCTDLLQPAYLRTFHMYTCTIQPAILVRPIYCHICVLWPSTRSSYHAALSRNALLPCYLAPSIHTVQHIYLYIALLFVAAAVLYICCWRCRA